MNRTYPLVPYRAKREGRLGKTTPDCRCKDALSEQSLLGSWEGYGSQRHQLDFVQ